MRKQKWYQKKAIWAWFIMIVMVASTAGFALIGSNTSSSTKIEYNGFTFYLTPNGYRTTINNVRYTFRYLPEEIADISSESININTNKVYLVYNPESDLNKDYALQLIGGFLYSEGLNLQEACIQEEGCGDIPIVKCSDARSMIYFMKGNNTSIYNDENCIVFEFLTNQDINKLHEKFIYSFLGVI